MEMGRVEGERERVRGFQGSSEGRKDEEVDESGSCFSFDVGRWMFDVRRSWEIKPGSIRIRASKGGVKESSDWLAVRE